MKIEGTLKKQNNGFATLSVFCLFGIYWSNLKIYDACLINYHQANFIKTQGDKLNFLKFLGKLYRSLSKLLKLSNY